jgi:hypothetical protein
MRSARSSPNRIALRVQTDRLIQGRGSIGCPVLKAGMLLYHLVKLGVSCSILAIGKELAQGVSLANFPRVIDGGDLQSLFVTQACGEHLDSLSELFCNL